MTNIQKSQYDKAVGEIRELLANWLESGVDLFLRLRDVDVSGVWKLPGHATFSDFLRAEFPTALGIERYQNVINAIELYGVERVKQIGIESCHALTVKALAEDATKRAQALAGIDTFIKKNGCAPDRNKVRELVASVAPETRRPPKELLEPEEIALMKQKLEAVKTELNAAKKRIRELENEVKKLRGKKSGRRAAAHARN
jgi:polyhydroxyalkanoate synthesis regulator phasin